MRIGNFEDQQTLKETTPPDENNQSSIQQKRKKWKNWWYYYKWYVICGILLLGIMINLIGSALGLWTKTPDLQIAYIGKTMLPEDTVSSLEKAFASIASDFNNDGEILVRINQYVNGSPNADADTAYYEYASEISLISDISNCDSYFFLMDNPDLFQQEFQLLASFDGSCPEDGDYSAKDKVIAWSDCSILSEADLGTYSAIILGEQISGSNQELLSSLYIGRRCFFTDKITPHADKCSELWDTICHSSLPVPDNR